MNAEKKARRKARQQTGPVVSVRLVDAARSAKAEARRVAQAKAEAKVNCHTDADLERRRVLDAQALARVPALRPAIARRLVVGFAQAEARPETCPVRAANMVTVKLDGRTGRVVLPPPVRPSTGAYRGLGWASRGYYGATRRMAVSTVDRPRPGLVSDGAALSARPGKAEARNGQGVENSTDVDGQQKLTVNRPGHAGPEGITP